jgi:hypothetical protein
MAIDSASPGRKTSGPAAARRSESPCDTIAVIAVVVPWRTAVPRPLTSQKRESRGAIAHT